jgi:hypothetical protein
MIRTQITLTKPLYDALLKLKTETGLSISELIRRAVELLLAAHEHAKRA